MKDLTDVKDSSVEHSSAGIGEAGQIVEESGPVDYCQDEGEGMNDAELEQLAYDGDPLLLLSDYEEEEEGKQTCTAATVYCHL